MHVCTKPMHENKYTLALKHIHIRRDIERVPRRERKLRPWLRTAMEETVTVGDVDGSRNSPEMIRSCSYSPAELQRGEVARRNVGKGEGSHGVSARRQKAREDDGLG